MGKFYRGTGYFRDLLGSCEGGTIYSGTGIYRERIGSYRNGTVYDIHGDKAGSYEDGWVRGVPTWNSSAETVGYYKGGTIYEGLTFGTSVGSYEDGSDGGAEAAAYLLLMREGVPAAATESSDSPANVPGSGGNSGGSGANDGGGSGVGAGCLVVLAVLASLLLVSSFGLIWWAIFKATKGEDTPYLIILIASIMLGLFLGLAVFKTRSLFSLYLTTAITASIITIAATLITDNSNYSFIVIILAGVIVVALASVIPTLLAYLSASLICKAAVKRKTRQSGKAAQPAHSASSEKKH